MRLLKSAAASLAATMVVTTPGCKPSDVLSVPTPVGVSPGSAFQSREGAELLAASGRSLVFQGFASEINGVLEWSSLLSDEANWGYIIFLGSYTGPDARITSAIGGFVEPGDTPLINLMSGRVTLLTALPALERYEPASGQSPIGEAFALLGYAELLAAEDYCAGLPLATPTSAGITYGSPLTTDSLLAAAEAHFDSALAHAGGDAKVQGLAQVGLGRARLNRGKYDGARSAVAGVPTNFLYTADLQPGGLHPQGNLYTSSNLYDFEFSYDGCGEITTADRKGGNGLPYVSANDPRLVISSALGETCDGYYGGLADSVWYYPTKFGTSSSGVPLATGVEARLIEAEAALQASQVATWASDLNALRADAGNTYLALGTPVPALTNDSTTTASAALRADVMFRERAFWLYGTGTRLGDMRRLVRQYGRDESTVFAVGPYPNGSFVQLPRAIANYGTDVSLTLPTAGAGLYDPNANYKGCLNHAA